MFDDNIFERWLDDKSQEIVTKLGNKEPLSSEEMIILVLKAQANHFHHLDMELRQDIRELREDMAKRFEQVDRRFEQVDKRFEQVDKRFERIYSFMKWQTGLGVVLLSSILIKLILG